MRATRRAVLLAAAAAATGACTGGDERAARPAPVDPDVALRAEAVAREQTLLAAYDAALAAEPERAVLLAPLRAEHEAHLAALGAPSPAGPQPSAATTTAAVSRSALVQAERAAAAAHAAATVPASPALAAVLAQLAASEASHPVALA